MSISNGSEDTSLPLQTPASSLQQRLSLSRERHAHGQQHALHANEQPRCRRHVDDVPTRDGRDGYSLRRDDGLQPNDGRDGPFRYGWYRQRRRYEPHAQQAIWAASTLCVLGWARLLLRVRVRPVWAVWWRREARQVWVLLRVRRAPRCGHGYGYGYAAVYGHDWRRWACQAGDEPGSGTCEGHKPRTAWVSPVCAVMLFFGHHTFVSYHILAVCRSHALFFAVTTTEVLSSSTIIVSFVRLLFVCHFGFCFGVTTRLTCIFTASRNDYLH